MGIFGRDEEPGEQPLARIIREIGEDVRRRALVQITPAGSRRTWWGVVLLSENALHLVYGEGRNWLAQLARRGSPEQHLVSVRLEEIERVVIPPRGGFLRRVFSGPTRIARIHRRDGGPIELEVDDEAAAVVEEAGRRAAARRP